MSGKQDHDSQDVYMNLADVVIVGLCLSMFLLRLNLRFHGVWHFHGHGKEALSLFFGDAPPSGYHLATKLSNNMYHIYFGILRSQLHDIRGSMGVWCRDLGRAQSGSLRVWESVVTSNPSSTYPHDSRIDQARLMTKNKAVHGSTFFAVLCCSLASSCRIHDQEVPG